MGNRGSKMKKEVGAYERLEEKKLGRRGYVPVRVGMEEESSRRFMVNMKALRDSRFRELLSKSAEEYGFRNDGVLRIFHEPQDFEDWILTSSHEAQPNTTLKSILSLPQPPYRQFLNKFRRHKFS